MLISGIKVGNRFRKDIGNITSLEQSINEIELLHAVLVNENNELIAGNRRLKAAKQQGWIYINDKVVNLKSILGGEFHESVLRKDFTITAC